MKQPHSLRSKTRQFLSQGEGATAVEFALVAPAFIALLWAILQTALVFFAQQVLQTATTQAARLIMTGQAQSSNMTAAQFTQQVCTNAAGLFSCGGLYANVQTFTSFSNATMYNPISNGKFSSSNMTWSPGGTGSIEVVQVFYQWPVWPGPLGFNYQSGGTNSDLIVATSAFRNEP
jgi:Flp pilus assembly protein TadG